MKRGLESICLLAGCCAELDVRLVHLLVGLVRAERTGESV